MKVKFFNDADLENALNVWMTANLETIKVKFATQTENTIAIWYEESREE